MQDGGGFNADDEADSRCYGPQRGLAHKRVPLLAVAGPFKASEERLEPCVAEAVLAVGTEEAVCAGSSPRVEERELRDGGVELSLIDALAVEVVRCHGRLCCVGLASAAPHGRAGRAGWGVEGGGIQEG